GAGDDVGNAVTVDVAGGYVHAGSEERAIGVEIADHLPCATAKNPDVWAGARPRPGDDVGIAVAVHVAGGHVDAAGERRRVGIETGNLVGLPDGERARPVKDLDIRPAARPNAGDDIGVAVVVNVGSGHMDAAFERERIRPQRAEEGRV